MIKKTDYLLPKVKKKAQIPTLTPLVQPYTGDSNKYSKARKRNTRQRDWKGRSNHDMTVFIENPKQSTKKPPRTNK